MHLRNNKHTSTPQKDVCGDVVKAEITPPPPTSAAQQQSARTRTGAKGDLATETPKHPATHELRPDSLRDKRLRMTTPESNPYSTSSSPFEGLFWTYPDTPCPVRRKQCTNKPVTMRQTTPIVITDESDVNDDDEHDEQGGYTEDDEEVEEEAEEEVEEEIEVAEMEGEEWEGDVEEVGMEDEEMEEEGDDDEVTFIRENVIGPVSTRRQYADKHPPPPSPTPLPSPLPSPSSAAAPGAGAPTISATIDPCNVLNRLMQKPEVWPYITEVLRDTGALHIVPQQIAAKDFVEQRAILNHAHAQAESQAQLTSSAIQQNQPSLITPTTSSFGTTSATSSPLSQAEILLPFPQLSTLDIENTPYSPDATPAADGSETTLPPTIWSTLEEDMIQYPSVDSMELFWRMGIQFGIGAGVATFREALDEVAGGTTRQPAEDVGRWSTPPTQGASLPATEDVSVAARAAGKVLWARQRVVDAIVSGGAAQHVRESGGFIRACNLLEAHSAGDAVGVGDGEFCMVDDDYDDEDTPVMYTAGGDFIGGVDMRQLDGTAGVAARMLLEHEMNMDEL